MALRASSFAVRRRSYRQKRHRADKYIVESVPWIETMSSETLLGTVCQSSLATQANPTATVHFNDLDIDMVTFF